MTRRGLGRSGEMTWAGRSCGKLAQGAPAARRAESCEVLQSGNEEPDGSRWGQRRNERRMARAGRGVSVAAVQGLCRVSAWDGNGLANGGREARRSARVRQQKDRQEAIPGSLKSSVAASQDRPCAGLNTSLKRGASATLQPSGNDHENAVKRVGFGEKFHENQGCFDHFPAEKCQLVCGFTVVPLATNA
jgi:hypothetical protein